MENKYKEISKLPGIDEVKTVPMNRAQRRAAKKGKKHKIDTAPVCELTEEGSAFIEYLDKFSVDANAFFVAFAAWLKLPQKQKEAVIVKLALDGKLNMEDGKEEEADDREVCEDRQS